MTISLETTHKARGVLLHDQRKRYFGWIMPVVRTRAITWQFQHVSGFAGPERLTLKAAEYDALALAEEEHEKEQRR